MNNAKSRLAGPKHLISTMVMLSLAGCQPGVVSDSPEERSLESRNMDGAKADIVEVETRIQSVEPGFLLRPSRVIAVAQDEAVDHLVVAIRGGLIEFVGPEEDLEPVNLEEIDLEGMTLMPGLIDSHIHLAANTSGDPQGYLDALLAAGVTAVKDVGSRLDEILNLRDAIADGLVAGPTIVACGPVFTASCSHPVTTLFRGDDALIASATRTPSDSETARIQVRELVMAGVDQIKAIMTDCQETCCRMNVELLDAIVDEAHAQGLRVVVHTDSVQDVLDTIATGADGLEHAWTEPGTTPEPEFYERMNQSSVFVVPTLQAARMYSYSSIQELRDRLIRMQDAGVNLAVGTDAPMVPFGSSVPGEMEQMVQAGFSPMQAIRAATWMGAVHLEREGEMGTIEAGKRANLIAVTGNPLEDIRVMRDVALVIKDGEFLVDRR